MVIVLRAYHTHNTLRFAALSAYGGFAPPRVTHTEEEANRRGGWFIHKCKNAKVAGYFWVKNPEN